MGVPVLRSSVQGYGACVGLTKMMVQVLQQRMTVSNSPATTSKKNIHNIVPPGTVVEDLHWQPTLSDYKVKKDLISQSTIKCGAA